MLQEAELQVPEFRTGRALVGGLPSNKTEVYQSPCVVMKSTDVRDGVLMHGQTFDFLETDADVETVENVAHYYWYCCI